MSPSSAGPEGLLERALRELVRYFRHSAAGRRCHGIIHNLNAPLQVLSFQLEILAQKASEEQRYLAELASPAAEKLGMLLAQRQQRLKQMSQELENLQIITRDLLRQAAHEDQEDPQYIDLNRLYQDELALFQNDLFFKHQVQTRLCFGAALPPIYGHYLDFSQSFRNVVENALEAMENVELRRLTVETELEGNRRLIRIGDTGCGIPAALADRIFEPFFTTKSTAVNPRAGLGLYMAKRLLAPYGGCLQAVSGAGQTWVTIILPVS
ncbi:MAG: ATP-binding protein [Deltaproteobacteria bacterium]|nr:ATP-binding protein [Deltaproteobacteria bacterium]